MRYHRDVHRYNLPVMNLLSRGMSVLWISYDISYNVTFNLKFDF